MADLDLQFGGDLSVGPTGDLGIVSAAALGRQRVLRRLLTNAGDYIWQLTYGAGLGRYVGQPSAPTAIIAIVTNQLLLEDAVAKTPQPQIGVTAEDNGYVALSVNYTDTETQQVSVLNFSV